MKTFISRSPVETVDLGKSFAATLKPGSVVALFGNLGSGKTQFVKGVCDGLRVRTRVGSPSFTIVNEYEAPSGKVAHIDLYRISSTSEIAGIGLEEYLSDGFICLIEWAEKVLSLLPVPRYDVKLTYGSDENEREISIQEVGGTPG